MKNSRVVVVIVVVIIIIMILTSIPFYLLIFCYFFSDTPSDCHFLTMRKRKQQMIKLLKEKIDL